MRGNILVVRIDGTTIPMTFERSITMADLKGVLDGFLFKNPAFDTYVDNVTGRVYPAKLVTDGNSSRNTALESIIERSAKVKGMPSPFPPGEGKFMTSNAAIIWGDKEFMESVSKWA